MTGLARIATLTAAATFAVATVGVADLAAQAWAYPSFQQPRVVEREFNFAVADAAGTSLIFQWREGISARSQWGLDVGFADRDGDEGDGVLILGGSFAYQLTQARDDMPLDFLLTTGLGIGITDPGNTMRIPVGVSIGHEFELDQGMALTPYIHPRLSIDYCGDCGPDNDSETELGVDFDIGLNFRVNQTLALRFSALFGGSELFGNEDGIGLSLAWTPLGLKR